MAKARYPQGYSKVKPAPLDVEWGLKSVGGVPWVEGMLDEEEPEEDSSEPEADRSDPEPSALQADLIDIVTEEASPTHPASVRERIAAAALENVETLSAFFAAALGATKTRSVKCKCGLWVDADVPDWAARDKIVNTMLNQGFGRPSLEVGEGGGGFTLQRIIVAPDGTEVMTDGDPDLEEGG